MDFKFLESTEIDKSKWNSAIDKSYNKSLFGYTWYLDMLCPKWCALIAGNYEYILPLPYKKRFFWKIIYTPPFTSRFEVYSAKVPDDSFIQQIFRKIPSRFKFLSFNFEKSKANISKFINIHKTFQKLTLNKSYEELYNSYSKSHKKNILRAKNTSIEIVESTDVRNIIFLQKSLFSKKKIHFSNIQFEKLVLFYKYLIESGLAYLLEAKKDDEVLSSILIYEYNDNVTIYSATSELGKKNGSFFLLMDYYIKNNCNTKKIIDFGGSSIQGIRERNLGFGAEDFIYNSLWSKDIYLLFRIIKKWQ